MRQITEKESLATFHKVVNGYAETFYKRGYNEALTDILKELEPFKDKDGYTDKNIKSIAEIIFTLAFKD